MPRKPFTAVAEQARLIMAGEAEPEAPVIAPVPVSSTYKAPLAPAGIMMPSWWEDICFYTDPGACRPVVAIVGPTGNGKTTVAEAAMLAHDWEYIVIDMTESMQPEDLVGFLDFTPQGSVWRDGPLTEALREGKAIIINEFDAADPRTVMKLHSLFQDAGPLGTGQYLTTPGGPEDRVYPKRNGHETTPPIVLTMNTYGRGADRMYVGRNSLDAATMDRITVITTNYENEVEIMAMNGVSSKLAAAIVKWAERIRSKIEQNGLRISLSPRTMLRIADTVTRRGLSLEQAIDKEFLNRIDSTERALLQ